MLLRPVLLTALLASAVSLATTARADAPNMMAAIAQIEASGGVRDIIQADLNLDGVDEALVLMADGCQGDLCPWSLIGSVRGGFGVVANGLGAKTDLVDTYPDGRVIRSDGVILAWDGASLLPHHDLLTMGAPRRATAPETRRLNSVLTGNYRAMDLQVWETDPFLSGEIWSVVAETGPPNLRQAPNMTGNRFHILSADGEVVLSGSSYDRPWIYQDVTGGDLVLRVVSRTGTGLLIETIHE